MGESAFRIIVFFICLNKMLGSFLSNLGLEFFFLRKNYTPALVVKWSFSYVIKGNSTLFEVASLRIPLYGNLLWILTFFNPWLFCVCSNRIERGWYGKSKILEVLPNLLIHKYNVSDYRHASEIYQNEPLVIHAVGLNI